jgi:hypothetical protein
MTQLKNKNQTTSPRDDRFDDLLEIFSKLSRKAARIKKQIMKEIESDWIFQDLTSSNQSYSF